MLHNEPLDRRRSLITGILFITASVTAILGVVLYGPALTDPNFTLSTQGGGRVLLGVLCELTLACAAVGTSLTLFPVLRRHSEGVALGYVAFRLLEAVLIVLGALCMLALLSVRLDGTHAGPAEAASVTTAGALLRAMRTWTFILGPNFMLGLNTLLYSALLLRSRLVPRPLATLGVTGAVLVLLAALLELFGVIEQMSLWGVGLALPVAAYEMILAGWLIRRGFGRGRISRPVRVSGVASERG